MQDSSIGKTLSYLKTLPLRQYVQAMPGKVKNWYQGTRISSYFERQEVKKLLQKGTFESDLFKLETSIRFRPNNWVRWDINGKTFELENKTERMLLWLANDTWELYFTVNGRSYGGIHGGTDWFRGRHIKWRRKLYKLGMKAVETKWIRNGPF